MPVIISANKENEIKRAVRLAEEFNLNYLISGAIEGWRTVDLLKKQQKPVLLSLNFTKPERITGYSYKLKIEGPTKEKKKDTVKPDKKDKATEKKQDK